MSLEDELFEKDIKIAELYDLLKKTETKAHTLRTVATSAIAQATYVSPRHRALTGAVTELTSVLDWTGDLLFYLASESIDLEENSLDHYKTLRDMNYPVFREDEVDTTTMEASATEIRIDLFRLYDHYYEYINGTTICGKIFEECIEAARRSVKCFKGVKLDMYGRI